MKAFLQGAGFGLLFSMIAMVCLRLSPVTLLPEGHALLFIAGGGLMGGLFHLLLGSILDVRSESNSYR